MKVSLKNTGYATGYRIAIVALMALVFLMLYNSLFSDGALSLFTKVLYSIADSMLLMFPFVFLKRKYLYLVAIWFAILSALVLANLLYFRNFGDVIPGVAYFTPGGINRFVFDSGVRSLRVGDLAIALSVALAIMVTIIGVRLNVSSSRRMRWLYSGVMCLLIAAQVILSIRRTAIYSRVDIRNAPAEYVQGFALNTCWYSYVLFYGFSGYVARAIADNFSSGYTASDADLAEARKFWQDSSRIAPLHDSIAAAVAENVDKNLIIVIVESLNSKVFRLSDAPAIMPYLDSLAKDPDVLYFPKIESMVGHGRSSDGQLMYNTGLLPLRDEAFVSRYSNADYPSLAKMLACPSAEIVGEDKSLWSHAITSISYGYDRLIDHLVPKGTIVAAMNSSAGLKLRAFTTIAWW